MKKVFLLLSFIFVGCATAPKVIKGPDGTTHKLLTCDEVEDCYEEANQVCGKYQIVNTSSEITGTKDSVGSLTKMLVKCKD